MDAATLIFLCVVAVFVAQVLVVPWIGFLVDLYWGWCLRKQREMKAARGNQ